MGVRCQASQWLVIKLDLNTYQRPIVECPVASHTIHITSSHPHTIHITSSHPHTIHITSSHPHTIHIITSVHNNPTPAHSAVGFPERSSQLSLPGSCTFARITHNTRHTPHSTKLEPYIVSIHRTASVMKGIVLVLQRTEGSTLRGRH